MFTHRTVSIVIKSYPATYTEFDKQSKYIDIELYDHIHTEHASTPMHFSIQIPIPALDCFINAINYHRSAVRVGCMTNYMNTIMGIRMIWSLRKDVGLK